MNSNNIKDFSYREKQRLNELKKQESKKKSDSRKKVLLLFISAVFVGLLIGGTGFSIYKWLAASKFFQLTSINVEGSVRLGKQQVMALAGIDYQSNLLAISTGKIKTSVESHNWIRSVEIKRTLPSELTIFVKERSAVALINTGKGLYYVDKNGVAFAPAEQASDLDYPVITGLENELDVSEPGSTSALKGKEEQLKKALSLIRLAGKGSSSLPRQNISEINLLNNDEIVLFLADNPFPIYMGAEVSSKRYYRLAKVLYWLYKKREFSDVNFIRMDYMNNKILVGKNSDV